MDLLVYDEGGSRYVPWRLALLLPVLAAVVATSLTLLVTRQDAETVATPVPPTPAVVQPADVAPCRTAVRSADSLVARGEQLEAALAAQTRVVDDALVGQITAEQAVSRSVAELTRAADHRRQFFREREKYQAARAACR